MFCVACGKQLDDTVKFCRYCGASMKEFKHKGVSKEVNKQLTGKTFSRNESTSKVLYELYNTILNQIKEGNNI